MSKLKAASWPFPIHRPSRSKKINYLKFNGETVMKLEDKLVKVNDNFNVYMYDNGYMLEISGRDNNEDWSTAKILCKDLDELITLIKEASAAERD
jgi:hypothetical protein